MMNQLSYLSKKETIIGYYFLFFQAVFLPLALELINRLLSVSLSDVKLNFLYFCINFLCAVLVFNKYLHAQAKHFLTAPRQVLDCALQGFILYYAASIGIGILIQYLYPAFINENDASIAGLVQDDLVLTGIGTVLLVPIVEELLYRALFFGSIHKRSRIAAYILNILVFGGVHIVGYIGTADPISLLLSFLQYVPACICLCWAYERSGSIFAPMLMHMAINLLGIFLVR
jgi:membrane protease YdiL (CAAX protease family)